MRKWNAHCTLLTKALGFTRYTLHVCGLWTSEPGRWVAVCPLHRQGAKLQAPQSCPRSHIMRGRACAHDLTPQPHSAHYYNPEGAQYTTHPCADPNGHASAFPRKGRRGAELPGNGSASPCTGKQCLGQASRFSQTTLPLWFGSGLGVCGGYLLKDCSHVWGISLSAMSCAKR